MGTDIQARRPETLDVSSRGRDLIAQSLATSTQHAYRRDLEAWAAEGVTVPADPAAIVDTLARWHDQGLAPATLTRRAAGLSTVHALAGYPSPCRTPAVQHALTGIRREAAGETNRRGRGKAQAVKADTLRRILPEPRALASTIVEKRSASERRAEQAALLRDTRDRALLLIGFAGALRRSELVALNVEDVTRDGHRGIRVDIRRSKTDQEGKGETVGIPAGGMGADVAEALESWLMLSGITEGPLFRRIDRHGNVRPQRITPEAANRIVQARAEAAGVDADGISAHSLRAGYITTQAERNVPEHRIQRVSRHRSAMVLRGYIRDATIWENTPDLAV